jgi:hypothetical protein
LVATPVSTGVYFFLTIKTKEMYPVIIFIIALFLSIQCIVSNANIVARNLSAKDAKSTLVTDLLTCIFWGWLYYLSH